MLAFHISGNLRVLALMLWLLSLQWMECGAQYLPHEHYKYQTLLAVCKKIAAAKGDVRLMPSLEVNSKKSSQQIIAQFKPDPLPKIIIDEKLYDLCTNFGTDSLHALACIVGHEMAHFYENHAWGNSFADMIDMVQEDKLAVSQKEKRMLEAEADYFGLFYGFLAGYETFRLLPEILAAIYQTYDLPEQLEGYPSKQDRLLISREKVRELLPLVYAFRAGQLLYLRKNYKEAAVCFDYILSKYPGREVYNNAGVTKLAQAIELMDVKEVYFAYPFELDANTRLRKGSIRSLKNEDLQKQRIKTLLSEAQQYFEQAIAIDRSYAPAYINLACTYSLQNNQAAAIGKINELENISTEGNSNLPGNAHLLRGIALVKNGQIDQAQTDFEQAVEKNAYQATYNRALYQKANTHWQVQISDWLTHWTTLERWIYEFWNQPYDNNFGLKSEKIPEEYMMIHRKETRLKEPFAISIADADHPIKIMVNDDGDQLTLELVDYTLTTFLAAPSYRKETAREVPIGALLTEVREKYGEPTYSLAGSGSLQYDYYEHASIIFEIEDEKVRGWWIYQVSY